jgi:hypothetical protein
MIVDVRCRPGASAFIAAVARSEWMQQSVDFATHAAHQRIVPCRTTLREIEFGSSVRSRPLRINVGSVKSGAQAARFTMRETKYSCVIWAVLTDGHIVKTVSANFTCDRASVRSRSLVRL